MPTTRLKGDARGAVKAHVDLQAAMKATAREASNVETRLTAAEKAARRIKEAADPQARYNRRLRETARLVHANQINLEQAQHAARRYRRQLDGVGRVGKSSLGGIARSAKNALVTYISLQGAISAVRAELQATREFEESRTQSQLGLAEAQQQFRQNIATFSPRERLAMEIRVQDLAQMEGLRLENVYDAAREAISASGVPERAIAAIEVATQFTRVQEDIKDVAGGINDILFATGKEDPMAALGILVQTAAQSRQTTVAAVAREGARVANAFIAQGSTLEEGLAVFTTLTKAGADPQGRISRTGAINLITVLQEFFKQDEVALMFDDTDIDTFQEQWDLARGDDLMKEEFKKFISTKFRAAIRPAIIKLLDQGPEVTRTYETVRQALADEAGMRQIAEEAISVARQGPLQETARREGRLRVNRQLFDIRTQADVTQENEQRLMELASTATGDPFTIERMRAFFEAGTTFDREELPEYLRGRIQAAERNRELSPRLRADPDSLEALQAMQRSLDAIETNQRAAVTSGRAE